MVVSIPTQSCRKNRGETSAARKKRSDKLRRARAFKIQANRQVDNTWEQLKVAQSNHARAANKLDATIRAVKHHEELIKRIKIFGIPPPMKKPIGKQADKEDIKKPRKSLR